MIKFGCRVHFLYSSVGHCVHVSSLRKDEPLVNRVLYIDDDALACRSLSALLQTMGYGVDSVENPIDGLELFRSGRYSLVITDMNMPEMDGLGLTREVKRIAPRTPVIVISGGLDSSTIDQTGTHRPDCVLQKPFAFEEFSRELLRLMAQSQAPGPDSSPKST